MTLEEKKVPFKGLKYDRFLFNSDGELKYVDLLEDSIVGSFFPTKSEHDAWVH